MQQPTLWEWAVFFVSLGLMAYAAWLLAAAYVPGFAGLSRLFGRGVDRAGRWTIVWFYWPLFLAIRRVAIVVWELPGHLWRGPREEPTPAPVAILSVSLPASYVAGAAEGVHQNGPSAPSAVRPSVPSAPIASAAPVVPPAVAQLTIDRSREGLIAALVAAGWSTTQIRGVVKGTNKAIGQDVEAARARLAAPCLTPIAGRELGAEIVFPD